MDAAGPVELVEDVGCDDLRDASAGRRCDGTGAAVVDHRLHAREQEAVVDGADRQQPGRREPSPEPRPACAHQRPAADGLDRVGDDAGLLRRVVRGHAPEADVDGRLRARQEGLHLRGERFGRLEEPEAGRVGGGRRVSNRGRQLGVEREQVGACLGRVREHVVDRREVATHPLAVDEA